MATSSARPAAALMRSPLGWVCVVARPDRVLAVSLASTRAAARRAFPAGAAVCGSNRLLREVLADLGRYFDGQPVDLSRHPVEVCDQPPFLRAALLAARGIPYGQVRTYGWLARAAGRPGAARAAGQAMSRNPAPLLIPCHRVIGAGGRLTGFGGGLSLKRALLELEGVACDHWRARLRQTDAAAGREP